MSLRAETKTAMVIPDSFLSGGELREQKQPTALFACY